MPGCGYVGPPTVSRYMVLKCLGVHLSSSGCAAAACARLVIHSPGGRPHAALGRATHSV